MNYTHYFGLFFALAACAGSSKDTTEDSGETVDTSQDSGETVDTSQDSGETVDTFELTEGIWVGTYAILENDCDAEPHSGDLEMTVSNLDGNTFTLASEAWEFSCAIEGVSATCDPIVYDETAGGGVSVLSTGNMGFTLESESTMSGLSFIEYSCEGEECMELAGVPEGVFCTVDVPFEASLAE